MQKVIKANRPSAVIHIDLDGVSDIYAAQGLEWNSDQDPLFESGLDSCLQFLATEGLKATLFVIARDLENPAKLALLQRAVDEGHEIASHSLTHPNLYSCSPDEKKAEIFESKRLIEETLDCEVRGFRAPSYSIDRETFQLVCDAGYDYDSSVFPDSTFARKLRIPAVLPQPFKPLLDEETMELPMPAYKPGPFPFHPSYSQVLGRWYFDWRLRAFRKTGAPLILLFHLADFAEPVSKDKLPNMRAKIFSQSHRSADAKAKHCAKVIARVRELYNITTTGALLDEPETKGATDLVLGISTTHETGSALFEGHECLAAISEERLDRVKFSTVYPPTKSIRAVLKETGVSPDRITDVVVAGLPGWPLLGRFLQNQWADTRDFHGWIDYFPHFNKFLYRAFAWTRAIGYGRVTKFLRRTYGIEPRLHFVPHHLCHAASVYRTAPFDDALVVTADGVGDYVSLSVSYGLGGNLKLHHLIGYPHSLGQFYTACTQVLGFKANRHEGKITGLSGFGHQKTELYEKVRSTIKDSGPGFKLDKRYYSEGIVRGFSLKKAFSGESLFDAFQYRNYKTPLKELLVGYDREDVAFVFQKILEEELTEIARPFAEQTKAKNLCLSGGIFANVKANAVLFRSLGFENVYIYPHMGDGGLGPGAALEFRQAKPKSFDNVYWGPSYTDDEIEKALKDVADAGLTYERLDDPELRIAELLTEKNVVARFDGRMEFGPRALCNRSILYSADEPEANTWLNKRLGRTEFMPFAPVVMKEHASKLFVGMEGTEHACQFMTIILDCTDWMKENCPAVVHVDGTARPQIVTKEINPSMHRILTHYEKATGVPVLVNTSFNMHEEPIVCSPEDAVRAYMDSKLDYLAIGPFLASLKCDE